MATFTLTRTTKRWSEVDIQLISAATTDGDGRVLNTELVQRWTAKANESGVWSIVLPTVDTAATAAACYVVLERPTDGGDVEWVFRVLAADGTGPFAPDELEPVTPPEFGATYAEGDPIFAVVEDNDNQPVIVSNVMGVPVVDTLRGRGTSGDGPKRSDGLGDPSDTGRAGAVGDLFASAAGEFRKFDEGDKDWDQVLTQRALDPFIGRRTVSGAFTDYAEEFDQLLAGSVMGLEIVGFDYAAEGANADTDNGTIRLVVPDVDPAGKIFIATLALPTATIAQVLENVTVPDGCQAGINIATPLSWIDGDFLTGATTVPSLLMEGAALAHDEVRYVTIAMFADEGGRVLSFDVASNWTSPQLYIDARSIPYNGRGLHYGLDSVFAALGWEEGANDTSIRVATLIQGNHFLAPLMAGTPAAEDLPPGADGKQGRLLWFPDIDPTDAGVWGDCLDPTLAELAAYLLAEFALEVDFGGDPTWKLSEAASDCWWLTNDNVLVPAPYAAFEPSPFPGAPAGLTVNTRRSGDERSVEDTAQLWRRQSNDPGLVQVRLPLDDGGTWEPIVSPT